MGEVVNTSGLNETSVAWLASGSVDEFGQASITGPIELQSRWELGTRLISDALVETANPNGIVYISDPLPVGTLLWRGRIADLPAVPDSLNDLFKVVEYREVPDVKGRESRLSVVVAGTKTKLPNVITPTP
jgi:hypothetical protein